MRALIIKIGIAAIVAAAIYGAGYLQAQKRVNQLTAKVEAQTVIINHLNALCDTLAKRPTYQIQNNVNGGKKKNTINFNANSALVGK